MREMKGVALCVLLGGGAPSLPTCYVCTPAGAVRLFLLREDEEWCRSGLVFGVCAAEQTDRERVLCWLTAMIEGRLSFGMAAFWQPLFAA